MQFPVIHSNGTDARTLLADYLVAEIAAENLIRALQGCAPNGRDYYPISQSAATKAMNEHIARLKKAEDILRELWAIGMSVSEQISEQAKENADH